MRRELPARTVVFWNHELIARTVVGVLVLSAHMRFRVWTGHTEFVNIV